jgi:membrane-anchored protein YejM (alkaline phosphatase superfamily)
LSGIAVSIWVEKTVKQTAKRTLWIIGCAIGCVFSFFVFKLIFSGTKIRPNIVLVVLDTVRSDYTGLKTRGDLTPCLNDLAKEGTVFPNAWSNAPWTVPSHASIFTGLLPSQHGCTTKNFYLNPKFTTLAEILGRQGYETAGFFSNPWLSDRASALMRGFQLKEEVWVGDLNRLTLGNGDQGGVRINQMIGKWLRERSEKKPFFLFVNYLEAHLPYDPPREYRKKYLKDLSPDKVVSIKWAHEFNAGLVPDQTVDWETVRRLYAGDVSSSDRLLGSLISMLKTRGLYKQSVLIVTSDHGELLGEHGLVEHQFSVYEPLLSVPLVVRAPAFLESGVNLKPVMLCDIFATLSELGGKKNSPDCHFSQSIFKMARLYKAWANPNDNPRTIISEYAGAPSGLLQLLKQINPGFNPDKYKNSYRTITDGRWRFTRSSDGKNVLSNLQDDPGEAIDFSSRFPGVAARMKRTLNGIFSVLNPESVQKKELNPQIQKKLKSLGYMQ